MISGQTQLNLSSYSEIYDLIVPKDNFLREMKELVDFTFVYEELASKYCLDNGRKAISPIRMFKYLLLKSIFNISDVDVVERSRYDMSFKYFLDMAPEEDVIDPSSLTKFRRLRLKDSNLMDLLIAKTVEIAIEKEVIKNSTIIVDSTHTGARYCHKTANEYLKDKSKAVRKAIYKTDPSFKKNFPKKPETSDVEEELSYSKKVINIIENDSQHLAIPAVKEKLNVLKEAVEDFTLQLSYSTDEDARFGHKTEDTSFFGYKTHIAMNDERIITAAIVTTGEKSDGKYLQELIERSKKTGIKVDTVLGDTAYSSKDNIIYTKKNNINLISKLHPIITNGSREESDGFTYNKDAKTYMCKAGHLATNMKIDRSKNEKKNTRYRYMFDVEKCKVCPFRVGCYKDGAKSKSYYLSIKSTEHKQQEAFQETDKFKRLSKERYKIEAKNSELKQRHGYERAIAAGLFGMQIQGATTIFAVNIKRIMKLIDEKRG